MLVTKVADEENVWRSVKDERICHSVKEGRLKLSASTFNDPEWKPSVDRVCLTDGDAAKSCKQPEAGVVQLEAEAVRQIKLATKDKKGNDALSHDVDVQHDPLRENQAHAKVVTAPHVLSEGAFIRLKEALCRIAERHGWVIPPASVRRGGH